MKIVSLIVLLAFTGAVNPLGAQIADSVWTIRGGSYAGSVVAIDKAAATHRSSHFWRMSKLRRDGRIVGWNPSRLPAPVAFRAGRGITESDSIAFWSILQQMEADLGMRLFEPATLGDSDPDDVIVVDTKNMAGDDGVTLITWSNSGAPYDARVYVSSRMKLHDPRIVAHEMMHALGFGHTSAWSSIMSPQASAPDRLTREDVAYAQVAFDSRAESERIDVWERVALAVEREPRKAPLAENCGSGYTRGRVVSGWSASGVNGSQSNLFCDTAFPDICPATPLSSC